MRIGMGWTLNLGHPLPWVLLAGLATLAVLGAVGVIDLPPGDALTLER